jgi:hypothetical protein
MKPMTLVDIALIVLGVLAHHVHDAGKSSA